MIRTILNKLFNFNFDSQRSSQWNQVRKKHLKNNPKCSACGRLDDVDVHHIIPVHIDPSKELDQNNLITLCSKYCHFTIGHLMDWKSWNIDVIDDARIYNIKIQSRPYKND